MDASRQYYVQNLLEEQAGRAANEAKMEGVNARGVGVCAILQNSKRFSN